MRNNKIFKAIAIAAPVLLSASAIGQILSTTVNFTTVQDVTIAEVAQPNFGSTVIPIAGRTCTMTPDITTASTTGAAPTYATVPATVAGSACDNSAVDAIPGQYALTGANNSQITITLSQNDITTDWTYDPTGEYDNGTSVTPVATATALTATLSATGLGYLSLGGTLSIINDLSFNIAYNDTYNIEVTY